MILIIRFMLCASLSRAVLADTHEVNLEPFFQGSTRTFQFLERSETAIASKFSCAMNIFYRLSELHSNAK